MKKIMGFLFLVTLIFSNIKANTSNEYHQKMLESILRTAPAGIGVVENRVLVQVNDYILNLTGYKEDELIGKSSRMLYATREESEYVGTEKYRQISQNGTGTVETRWITKNGEIKNVILSSTPLDPTDLSVGVTFTVLDITDRVAAQEKFENIFNNSNSVMLIVNPQTGEIKDANPAAANYYGWNIEELTSMKIQDINTLSYQEIQKRMTKAQDAQQNHFVFNHKLANGSIRDVAIYSSSVEIGGEKFLYSIVYDITNQVVVEKALARRTTIFVIGIIAFISILLFLVVKLNFGLKKQKETRRELAKRKSQLESFLDISREINSAFENKNIMQIIVDNATKATGLGSSAIYTLQENANIKLEATYPSLPDDFPEELRLAQIKDHTHIEKVFSSNTFVLLPDTLGVELSEKEREVVELRNLRSNLYLPIRLREKTIGILILSSVEKTYNFTNDEIFLLQGFADQAAQIIAIINNYNQVKKYAIELEQHIAERKHAERMLESERNQLLSIFNSIDEIIYISDTQTYDIIYVNDFLANKLSFDAIGKKCYKVLQGFDAPCTFCTNNIIVKQKPDPYKWEHHNLFLGSYYSVTDRIIKWSDGRDVRFEISVDITEIKEVQKQLDSKNKELEQIVYVASHDLRSPLVNVQGFSREIEYSIETVKEVVNKQKSEDLTILQQEFVEIEDFISRIKTSTRQMDKLLKGLLYLSRTGRSPVNIETLNMNKILEDVYSSFAFIINEKNIELTIEDLPDCMGSETQVNQVFSNLISNATKYLEESRPSKIIVSGFTEDIYCVYKIEDNGVGIKQEHIDKIFELFHRLDPQKTQGEGLGLTAVKQMLERMNGDIKVESVYGEGSIFIVKLPKC